MSRVAETDSWCGPDALPVEGARVVAELEGGEWVAGRYRAERGGVVCFPPSGWEASWGPCFAGASYRPQSGRDDAITLEEALLRDAATCPRRLTVTLSVKAPPGFDLHAAMMGLIEAEAVSGPRPLVVFEQHDQRRPVAWVERIDRAESGIAAATIFGDPPCLCAALDRCGGEGRAALGVHAVAGVLVGLGLYEDQEAKL